jgi:hypothetical protein
MSGICGICSANGHIPSTSLDSMLSALTVSEESSRGAVHSAGALFGVSRRWNFQQVIVSEGLLCAADAELLNLTSLAAEIRAAGVNRPLDSQLRLWRLCISEMDRLLWRSWKAHSPLPFGMNVSTGCSWPSTVWASTHCTGGSKVPRCSSPHVLVRYAPPRVTLRK